MFVECLFQEISLREAFFILFLSCLSTNGHGKRAFFALGQSGSGTKTLALP